MFGFISLTALHPKELFFLLALHHVHDDVDGHSNSQGPRIEANEGDPFCSYRKLSAPDENDELMLSVPVPSIDMAYSSSITLPEFIKPFEKVPGAPNVDFLSTGFEKGASDSRRNDVVSTSCTPPWVLQQLVKRLLWQKFASPLKMS